MTQAVGNERAWKTVITAFNRVTSTVRAHMGATPYDELAGQAFRLRPQSTRALPALDPARMGAGIHDADLGTFLLTYGTTQWRRELLRPFAERVLELQRAGVREVFVGGSVVSTKPRPGDVDALVHVGDRIGLRERASDWMRGTRWHTAERTHTTLDPQWRGSRPTWLEYFQSSREGPARPVVRIVLADG